MGPVGDRRLLRPVPLGAGGFGAVDHHAQPLPQDHRAHAVSPARGAAWSGDGWLGIPGRCGKLGEPPWRLVAGVILSTYTGVFLGTSLAEIICMSVRSAVAWVRRAAGWCFAVEERLADVIFLGGMVLLLTLAAVAWGMTNFLSLSELQARTLWLLFALGLVGWMLALAAFHYKG